MVKVLLATMTKVVSGSRPAVVTARSDGSMLEMNRQVSPGCLYGSRASYAITGPRSEPPMPMLMTVWMRLPVTPVHSPERTRPAKS